MRPGKLAERGNSVRNSIRFPSALEIKKREEIKLQQVRELRGM